MTQFFIDYSKNLGNAKNEAVSKKVQGALDKNVLQDKTMKELASKLVCSFPYTTFITFKLLSFL